MKTASFLLACALSVAPLSLAAQENHVVINAKRIFDGERMIENGYLVVRDGRVVSVGSQNPNLSGAETVNLSDRVIIPGLIAAHSHVGMVSGTEQNARFYTRENVLRDLAQFQRYGIVAVNALGFNQPLFYELRQELRGAGHGGADLYGAGEGYGAAPLDRSAWPAQATPRTPMEEARTAISQMAKNGIDMVKVWVDDLGPDRPKITPEVYTAVFEEAHKNGLAAAAHIQLLDDAKGVARAGADVIAHGVRDVLVDQEFIDLLLEKDIWYVPTIDINEAEYIYAAHPEWLNDAHFRMALNPALEAQLRDPKWRAEALAKADKPRQMVSINTQNLRLLHAAGVKIAMGTDSGGAPLRLIGFAEHMELERMVGAGMSSLEALRAATVGGADMMRLPDRGRLQAGSRADFVVLTEDPEANIRNIRTIEAVWRDGKPAPMATPQTAPQTAR